MTGLRPAGFPHSDAPGSKPVCGSPRLIAACRVLLRPRAPRHPPYALAPLTAPRIPPGPRHLSASRRGRASSPALSRQRPASQPLFRPRALAPCPSALVKVHVPRVRQPSQRAANRRLSAGRFMVGIGRLELPTSPLSGARSDHLSYMPVRPEPCAAPVGTMTNRRPAPASATRNALATEQCVGGDDDGWRR